MRTPARALLPVALTALLSGCAGSTPVAVPAGDRSPTGGATSEPSEPSARASATPTVPRPSPSRQAGSPAAPAASPSPSPVAATPGYGGPEDPLVPRPALESPAPLGAPTCQAPDLSVMDADAIVTPSSVRAVFAVRTTGGDCQLLGFPEVELRGVGGAVLPVSVRRGGFGLPAEQPAAVSLSRATSVSFQVATDRTGDCTQAESIVVRLPGSGGPLTTATELRVCGGAVGLSPVERGGSDH